MGKKLYKVTNRAKDERKFRDKYMGRDIILKPRESVVTTSPPEEKEIFEVEEYEERQGKKKNKEDE